MATVTEETEVGNISLEEYTRRLNAIMAAVHSVRRARGWCEEYIGTFLQLSADFRRNPGNRNLTEVYIPEEQAVRDMFTDDGWVKYQALRGYGKRLLDIRGRVLSLVQAGTITLPEAQQVLQAGELPLYGAAVTRLVSFEHGHRSVYVDTAETAEEIRARVGGAYQRFLAEVGAILDDRTGMTADLDRCRVREYPDAGPTAIQSGDLVRLLPKR